MRHFSRIVLAAVLVMFVALMPLRAAEPAAVVKLLPSDTKLFILIPKLSGLTEKYKLLSGKLGLPAEVDPLTLLKGQMGMMQGVDDNSAGAAALTYMPIPDPDKPRLGRAPRSVKPGAEGRDPEKPSGLVFVPVTDYKVFLGNFGDGLDAAGVATIQIQGEAHYVKLSGKYAVFGEKKDEVTAYNPPADNGLAAAAGELGGGVLTGSDALIFVDLSKLGPALRPQIKSTMDQAMAEIKRNPDPTTPMLTAWLDIYRRVIDNVITDGQSVMIGVDVTADGVGLSYAGQFKPGSPLAKTFGSAPAAPLSLNRLPTNRPYLFAMTMDLRSLPVKQWLKELTDATPADQPLGKILRDSAATWDANGGETQSAFYAPDIAGGGPPTFNNSITVYPAAKPADLLKAQKEMVLKMNGVKLDEHSGISYKTDFKDNVMQVGGFNVDKFSLRIDLGQQQGNLGNPIIGMMLGQDLGGYMVATDKALVMAAGADPVQLKDAIEASGGKGELDANANITAVRKNMMPHRVMEIFIGVETGVQLAKSMVPQFVPELPANLPPIALSFSVGGGGAGERLFVPMPVIVGVKKAIDKAQNRDEFAAPEADPIPAPGKQPDKGKGPSPAPAAAADPNIATFSDATFDADVLKSDMPVLVSFWGDWAPSRKVQDPIVSRIAAQYKDKIKVGKIDIDKNPKITDKYIVEEIPTLLIIKKGQVVATFKGPTKQEPLEAAIQKALAP